LKFKYAFLFCVLFFYQNNLQAKIITLLEVPLSNDDVYNYSVNQLESCSFEGVDKIDTPVVVEEKQDGFIIDKLGFFQKKINLGIKDQTITPERVSFNLSGAQNLLFQFYFKKCKLIGIITFDNKDHPFEKVEVEHDDTLKPVIIKRIHLKDAIDNTIETLYPNQMQGQVSAFELILGPALDIHSNIRRNNERIFEKSRPVIKPMPAFLARYGPVFLSKDGMGSLLYSAGNLSFLGMATIEGEPYKHRGLSVRETGIFVGGILKYKFSELIYYNDFINDKGYNLKLNIGPEYQRYVDWKIKPQVYLQYWDNEYVNYYFGVEEREIGSGFSSYKGKRTINYGTLTEISYFSGRWTYTTGLGAKFYGKEVSNSPTVVRTYELRGLFTVLYKIF
jgi:hypothetical protein